MGSNLPKRYDRASADTATVRQNRMRHFGKRIDPSKLTIKPAAAPAKKTGVVARYGKQLVDTAKLIGKAGVAIATEPFTNRLLKENMRLTDEELAKQEEIARQRKEERYSNNQ